MKPENNDEEFAFQRSAVLGFVAGLRSQIPFLMLARAAARNEFAARNEPLLRWLHHPRARMLLSLSAAGEAVVDKLPIVPNRTDPGPLLGRLMVGVAAGAVIATESRAPLAKHVAAGAAGALVGSFAGRFGRAFVVRATGLPDLAGALAEDGLAYWLGDRVMHTVPGQRSAINVAAPGQPNAGGA